MLLCTVNTIHFSLCVQAHKHSPGECVACTRLDCIERRIHPGWTHLLWKLQCKKYPD